MGQSSSSPMRSLAPQLPPPLSSSKPDWTMAVPSTPYYNLLYSSGPAPESIHLSINAQVGSLFQIKCSNAWRKEGGGPVPTSGTPDIYLASPGLPGWLRWLPSTIRNLLAVPSGDRLLPLLLLSTQNTTPHLCRLPRSGFLSAFFYSVSLTYPVYRPRPGAQSSWHIADSGKCLRTCRNCRPQLEWQ